MADPRDLTPLSEVRAAHRKLEHYFETTRDALAGAEAKVACAQLRDALETHFAQEESLYFPTLWNLRPEWEEPLRALLAAHSGFLESLARVAHRVDDGAPGDARVLFEELQHRFALHEQGEEKALSSGD